MTRNTVVALAILLTIPAALAASGPGAVLVADAALTAPSPHASFGPVACPVSSGQSALGALREAVADGCLSSIRAVDYGAWGHFLDCVQDVCSWWQGDASRSWALYENGLLSGSGVDGISVDDGDVVEVSYDQCPSALGFQCVPIWPVP